MNDGDTTVGNNANTYQQLTAVPDVSMERILNRFEQFEQTFDVDLESDTVQLDLQEYLALKEQVVQMLGLAYYALGLGEVGEIQGKIKKILRDKGGELTAKDVEQLSKELGDSSWYHARLADTLGLAFGDIMQGNIDKLFGRMERGTIRGSGDNR